MHFNFQNKNDERLKANFYLLKVWSYEKISNIKAIQSYLDIYFFHFKRLLNGYEFPVYTTKLCPRNKTQWNERSVALNCTESHGYVCIPNEHFTHLLEFCYFASKMLIVKGKELYIFNQSVLKIKYNSDKNIQMVHQKN